MLLSDERHKELNIPWSTEMDILQLQKLNSTCKDLRPMAVGLFFCLTKQTKYVIL